MNKQRRKQIADVIKQVEAVQAELESLLDDVQGIMDEETEYRDNIPENMQGGDRYEMADNACSELEAAHETLGNAKDSLEEVVSSLDSNNEAHRSRMDRTDFDF